MRPVAVDLALAEASGVQAVGRHPEQDAPLQRSRKRNQLRAALAAVAPVVVMRSQSTALGARDGDVCDQSLTAEHRHLQTRVWKRFRDE